MILVATFLFFSLACFFTFFLPGRWVLEKTEYKTSNTISKVTLSLAIGIATFLVGNYVLAWVHMSYLYLVAILPIIFLEMPVCIKDMRKNFSLRWVFSIESLLIFSGVLLMISATGMSGIGENGSLVFFGTNAWDGVYHGALIGNLIFQFPPSYPGLSHTLLQGYHFLYDFMLSQFGLFFGFNVFDLYFRFFSIFTAVFYGLSGITLSYSLKMNMLTRRVFIFLLFFAQGAEYFIFHWFHNTYSLYNSGIVQPVGNIVDPSILLSIAFVFLLFVVLFTSRKMQVIIPILFLGVLPGIKIYTGMLAYAATGVILLMLLFKRKLMPFFILIFASIISVAIYLPFNLGAGSLIFNPFLFFRHFMESDMVFASFQWPLKLQYYQANHNVLRIIYLYAIAVAIYFIPPLGIRLISIVKIKDIFHRKFYTPEYIFWIVFIVLGLLIPAFFIQSIAVFNTIQFFWLIWIVLLIPTAFSLTTLVGKVTTVKTIVLILCLIILSFPVLSFPLRVAQDKSLLVSKDLFAIAQSIHTRVPRTENILVVNRIYENGAVKEVYRIPLLAALSGRPMYYEPEQAEFSKIQHIEDARKKVVDIISFNLANCSNFSNNTIKSILQKEHVQHLVLLQNNGCISRLPSFTIVAQKGTYALVTVH